MVSIGFNSFYCNLLFLLLTVFYIAALVFEYPGLLAPAHPCLQRQLTSGQTGLQQCHRRLSCTILL